MKDAKDTRARRVRTKLKGHVLDLHEELKAMYFALNDLDFPAFAEHLGTLTVGLAELNSSMHHMAAIRYYRRAMFQDGKGRGAKEASSAPPRKSKRKTG